MNWRFSSRDISCSESNFRPLAVLISAVLILGSTFSGLVFTRGSVIRTVKNGKAILVTKIDIISLFLEILSKERSFFRRLVLIRGFLEQTTPIYIAERAQSPFPSN